MKFDIIYTSEAAAEAYGRQGPAYSTAGSCAFDLRANIMGQVVLHPGEQKLIPTGIKIHLAEESGLPSDVRVGAICLPRSGRGAKEGLCIGNTIGLIDEDYQGEIMLMVWARPTQAVDNGLGIMAQLGVAPLVIKPQERIAQLILTPMLVGEFHVVSEFKTRTVRGAGGHGSTGND